MFLIKSFHLSKGTGDAWQSSKPTYDSRYMRPGMAGSVQVVSSTNGELGPGNDDTHLVDRRTGVPLNSQPEVEIVDETKYENLLLHLCFKSQAWDTPSVSYVVAISCKVNK